MTVARACGHLSNFNSAHESRARVLGEARLDYPESHIEVDNRLSWFLGGLEKRYGGEPLYVHLRRDAEATARSFEARWGMGIIRAFAQTIIAHPEEWPAEDRLTLCREYVQTVTANIELFLRDKPSTMTVWLDDYKTWFPDLWRRIEGEGNLDAALAEFAVRHNATAHRERG